jgi:large subunit ribosomal protein L22
LIALETQNLWFMFQGFNLCSFFKTVFQSPKKVNLVAALVRGMLVKDALLQLQVLVKRASKTVYQVPTLVIVIT